MRRAKVAFGTTAAIACLFPCLLIALGHGASAKDKPAPSKPAVDTAAKSSPSGAPSDASGWSGQSGSSGNPLMTAEAIKRAAANFRKCLEDQWPEAQRRGVTRANFDAYTAKLTPDLQIMDLLDDQPEFARPVGDYVESIVTEDRIAQGHAALDQYRETFDAIENVYGVDRAVIAAIWSVETNFGKQANDRPVLRSTATLACVGRRQGYYREEFVSALEIAAKGDVAVDKFNGNWAGAFGGTQFMPTAFKQFAVDFDRDGKRDVFGSVPDSLASTANYLRYHGWYPNRPWGYEVKLPENFNYLASGGPRRSLVYWGRAGITLADGSALPQVVEQGSIMLPAGVHGPAFLVLDNFSVILSYNPSQAYALAVALLSDRLNGLEPLVAHWPRDERALTAAERVELQQRLQQRGLLSGSEPNGMFDAATRFAVQKFQTSVGITPDGFATATVLDRLRTQ